MKKSQAIKPVSDQNQQDEPVPKHISKGKIRQNPRKVELTLLDDVTFEPYPFNIQGWQVSGDTQAVLS
jgi:hypothetical protein